MSEYVDWRRSVYNEDANVAHQHRFPVAFDVPNGRGHVGTVELEYRPRNYVLNADGLDALAQTVTDTDNGDEPMHPERTVEAIYWTVVEAVLPGYQSRERPWENAPMVVSYSFTYDAHSYDDTSNTVTLGSFL